MTNTKDKPGYHAVTIHLTMGVNLQMLANIKEAKDRLDNLVVRVLSQRGAYMDIRLKQAGTRSSGR